MGAYNGLMLIEFGGARSRDQIFTGRKLAKNGLTQTGISW